VQWDIIATNLTKRKTEYFRVNEILSEFNDASLRRFMEVFLAGITTIPYFKAPMINDQYYLEGGYLDNTPLRPLFEDSQVDEIIAVDFTDYDYHAEIAKVYNSTTFTLPLNSIEMHLLVSDMELTLPNIGILSQALRINKLLQAVGKTSLEIDGKVYHYKPLHILKPKNLESMTISLKDSTIQKKYFELGGQEAGALFQGM